MGLLETRDLRKSFGGVMAVSDVTMDLSEGEILGVIGPNGSGKSTLINLLTGIYRPDRGTIRFDGRDITGLPAHRVTRRGIARTFQNLRVFSNVSVLVNIMIGQHTRIDNQLWTLFLRPLTALKRERAAEKTAREILAMANLAGRGEELAKSLPYGEQRLLEICRALAAGPRLLLLDEPCAGMNPKEIGHPGRFYPRTQGQGAYHFHRRTQHALHHVPGGSDHCAERRGQVQGRIAGGDSERSGSAGYLSGQRGRHLMFKVENLAAGYGNIKVLHQISIELGKGEIVAVLGANGAGKTTLLKTVTGLVRSRGGRVIFEDADITNLPAEKIVRRGISLVPEGRNVFARSTVMTNLEMGAFLRKDADGVRKDIEKYFEMFPILGERRAQLAGTLSGGEQQMLAIAPGVDEQAENAPARRTLHGPGPLSGERDHENHQGTAPGRHFDFIDRTECS